MRPRGRSRPLAALQLAASYNPTEVVLLTDDNFGLRSGEDVSPDALAELLQPADGGDALPTVNAVQFFYEDSEGRLKDIASRFGGRYQFVEEPPFDARPVPRRSPRRLAPCSPRSGSAADRRPLVGRNGLRPCRGVGERSPRCKRRLPRADKNRHAAPSKRRFRRVGQGSADPPLTDLAGPSAPSPEPSKFTGCARGRGAGERSPRCKRQWAHAAARWVRPPLKRFRTKRHLSTRKHDVHQSLVGWVKARRVERSEPPSKFKPRSGPTLINA